MASTNAASAAKSRAAVPSIELADDEENPSSAATASGSSPSDEPASAPEPYGDTAARRSQSRSRSTSRSSACACAARWCASNTGWACCRWVRPGIGAPGWASACASSASTTSSTPAPIRRAASRSHIRNRVATWSLRERPARSLPPSSGPARSIRPRSSAECTSSSSGRGPERARGDVGLQLGQRVQHPGQLGLGEQPGPGQHPRVRLRTAHVVRRQPPVELGRLRQRSQRVSRPAGEPPTPQPTTSSNNMANGLSLAVRETRAAAARRWARRAAIF